MDHGKDSERSVLGNSAGFEVRICPYEVYAFKYNYIDCAEGSRLEAERISTLPLPIVTLRGGSSAGHGLDKDKQHF